MTHLFDPHAGTDMRQIPKDRTKREHVGKVSRVLWSDPEKARCLLKLQDEKVVVIDEEPQAFDLGTVYRFMGRWIEGKKGPQFAADTYIADTPAHKHGVVRYLCEVCDRIGQRGAEKLWEKYGPDAIKMLRECPSDVVADGLLTAPVAQAAAAALAECVALERTKTDLFTILAGRGFPGKTIEHCIARWGAAAPAVIRNDPFKLLTNWIPGCGWKRCDRLHAELGLNRDSLKRAVLAGWNALQEDRTGSTWLPGASVFAAIQEAVPGCPSITKAMRLGIRAGVFRRRREGEEVFIAIADHARHEQQVADAVKRLNTGANIWPRDELRASASEGDGLPSEHQVAELRRAFASPVACLIGGPGTGKSYCVAEALKIIAERVGWHAISVAAPTGKAAGRLSEYMRAKGVPLKSSTIHSLLEIGRNGHDGRGWGFERNAANPLECRVLVVDEASMVDTSLMAALLDATSVGVDIPAQPEQVIPAGQPIPPRCRRCNRVLTTDESRAIGYGPECAKQVDPECYRPVVPRVAGERVVIPALPAIPAVGTHVLFVGDPFQLAPVGHGAPLRDMLAGGVSYGELTETRRNAGLIVRGCASIKAGRTPVTVGRFDLDASDPLNLRFVEAATGGEALDFVEKVLGSMTKFDPVWGTQILTATNEKSDMSRVKVNERFAKLLNPNGKRADGMPFAVGDKIICTRNSKLNTVVLAVASWTGKVGDETEPSSYQPDGRNGMIRNGDIGRVTAVNVKGMVVAFAADLFGIPKSKPRAASDGAKDAPSHEAGAMGDFEHAYGITGHKSQGSQWPCVIVLADKAGGSVADRNWWYTTISRAEKACLVVGDRSAFESQCRRETMSHRKTLLRELLAGEAVGSTSTSTSASTIPPVAATTGVEGGAA
jgi:hypothetical protein